MVRQWRVALLFLLTLSDLFQTDHRDYSISKTSSYLDLSILYGDSQEDQNQMRTFEHGRIKPDCFAEERLLAFPPSCGAMLIMLNRFHNYVVEQLALINENGRFDEPSARLSGEAAKAAWGKYDNDLFQTGRLITCGLYINITLHDYLRTIVNLIVPIALGHWTRDWIPRKPLAATARLAESAIKSAPSSAYPTGGILASVKWMKLGRRLFTKSCSASHRMQSLSRS